MEVEVCWLLQWRSAPCMLGVWWNVWEERVGGGGEAWVVTTVAG